MKNTQKYLALAAIVASALVVNGCVVNTGNPPNGNNPYQPVQSAYNSNGNNANAGSGAAGLQDLVGARGGSGDSELQNRGFTYVKGENGGGSSYTSWRRGNQCVMVRTANGNYLSIVDAPMPDCVANGQSDAGYSGGSSSGAAGLQDLVGVKGSSGESALQSRGYAFVKGGKAGDSSYTAWRSGNQCIWVRTANGRYTSIADATMADCR